jgi:D-citramalate synthase
MVESPDHVMALAQALLRLGVERLFLADTVGCLSPDDVRRHVTTMRSGFPEACFEFHGHNDYGLATANALAAVKAGVDGVHASINGLGERAGNASLAEVVVALHDHTAVRTAVDEAALYEASMLVERYSGKRLADNAPLAGADVFTQTAGVHADGDRKGNLYASRLLPERFGRTRAYALGKFSGRASVDQNLEALGIVLDEEQRDRLLACVVELGDRKRAVHQSELPALLAALCPSKGEFDKIP